MQVSDGVRPPTTPTEPTGQRVKRWPLFFIASPAAVAVWSGWVGLGALSGFGIVHPLPGIADGFKLNTAITLPVGVEAYGAYALGAWLTPGTSDAARRFARRSAVGSLALGMLGQVAYHVLAAAHATRAPWPVVVLVACLPVVTLGFGAALTHLLRSRETVTEAVTVPTVETLTTPARPPLSLAWPAPRQPRVAQPATAESGSTMEAASIQQRTRTAMPVSRADMETGIRPDTTRTQTRTLTRTPKTARAASIVRRQPDISGAELGRKLGVSERQGRRILADLTEGIAA